MEASVVVALAVVKLSQCRRYPRTTGAGRAKLGPTHLPEIQSGSERATHLRKNNGTTTPYSDICQASRWIGA
jgi:hypothetical protein